MSRASMDLEGRVGGRDAEGKRGEGKGRGRGRGREGEQGEEGVCVRVCVFVVDC